MPIVLPEGGLPDVSLSDAAPDAPAADLSQPDLPFVPADGPQPDVPFDPDLPIQLDLGSEDGPAGDIPFVPDSAPAEGGTSDISTSDDFLFIVDMSPFQSEAGKYICPTSTGGYVVCQCNDGVDNDGDGKIDYPNDPGCTDPWDNAEGSTQCNDGIDNDGDGLIDWEDPGCTGPLDNDESSFGTGIPGDNVSPCKEDCFFDGDSGSGNDGCYWNLQCDPLSPGSYMAKPCPYSQKFVDQGKCPTSQSQLCLDKCLPMTPNGCDCFGCCQVTDGTITVIIKLVDTCTIADLADPVKCPRCTQVQDCLNPCGLCEICIGKPAPDPSCFPPPPTDAGPADAWVPPYDGWVPPYDGWLPPDSSPAYDGGTTEPFCPPGIIYCGPGGIDPANCPAGSWCLTGCCIPYEG